MPRQSVEELRLEPGAGPLRVKVREERVVGLVEDDGRIEARTKSIGQQRFADAGRPLDRDVSEVQG
jgi:hypothetical protein